METFDFSNIPKSIMCENISKMLHIVLISFFSTQKKDFVKLNKIIFFLNDLFCKSIKYKVKNAGKGVSFVIHDLLMKIFNHIKILDIFKIEDFRFFIMFECLINIFKKLFFNTAAEIFCNIFDKLEDKEYLKFDEEMTCNFYVDFFREFKKFLEEFQYFVKFPGYFLIKMEFIRKVYFFFINHFRYLIDKEIIPFSFEQFMILLEGIIYFNKETAKFFVTNTNNEDNEKMKKVLVNYKSVFFKLGENLMNKITKIIDIEIEIKLKDIKIEDFDFEKVLKNNLKDFFEILKKEKLIYSKKVYNYLLIKLVEKYLELISNQSQSWIQENIKSEIEKKKKFFTFIETRRQKFDYFRVFLDYYKKFIITNSEEKAKNLLGMFPTILGQKLNEDTIYNIMKTRPGGFLNYKYLQMKYFYNSLLDTQKKGEIKKKEKFEKKKKKKYYFII